MKQHGRRRTRRSSHSSARRRIGRLAGLLIAGVLLIGSGTAHAQQEESAGDSESPSEATTSDEQSAAEDSDSSTNPEDTSSDAEGESASQEPGESDGDGESASQKTNEADSASAGARDERVAHGFVRGVTGIPILTGVTIGADIDQFTARANIGNATRPGTVVSAEAGHSFLLADNRRKDGHGLTIAFPLLGGLRGFFRPYESVLVFPRVQTELLIRRWWGTRYAVSWFLSFGMGYPAHLTGPEAGPGPSSNLDFGVFLTGRTGLGVVF